MNGEQKYNVVFTGRFAQPVDRAVIMQNLARLYKTDVDTVAQYFSDINIIVKHNLDKAAADQYVTVLNNIGALCEAVAVDEAEPADVLPPNYLEYRLGISELRCSPLPINRITQGQDGININRVDKQDVLFQDIILLSVYEHAEVADTKMLLFFRGCKQPFVCDCFKIAYSDFFDVKGNSMPDSIRRFAQYLFDNNQGLLFDKQTYEFIQGGKLPAFNGDDVRLATALSAALTQTDSDSPASSKISLQKRPEPVAKAVESGTEQELPPSVVCPKCGQGRGEDQLACGHCGIVFAKWQQNQEQKHQTKQNVAQSNNKWAFDDIDLWTQQGLASFAYLLIGGFALPLLKHSVLLGASLLIWPWNIMGLGMDAEKAAAIATVSIPEYMPVWGLLPLLVAIGFLSGRHYMALPSLATTMFSTGIASLALMLTVLYKESEILGLMFTPPTMGAGIMILLTVVAGTLVAGANRLRKRFPGAMAVRVLSGIGGGVMVALMVLQLFASSGGWAAWSMMLLYLLMLGYGVLGLFSALRPEPEQALLQRISLVARAILCWAPIACLISQNWQADSYTDFVIGGGGGFINIFISVAKCFLLYYGFSFLMAMGFTAYLEQSMLKKSGTL